MRNAGEKEKKVLVLALMSALLSVGDSLINLYVTPSVLAVVERRAPFGELVLTILVFAGLLMLFAAGASYVGTNSLYGRVQVRSAIITALNRKAATTSFPNVGDEKFKKRCAKASEAPCGNSEATEAVWNTLTNLTRNMLGFIIYVLLLSSLDLRLLLVIAVTTLAGYVINKFVNGYGYRHREEVAEHENRMWYRVWTFLR